MKKFCFSLRDHAKYIIDFEKMLPLKKEELKSHQIAKVCYIRAKRILKKHYENINDGKVRDRYHYTRKYRRVSHSICNLKFNVPNEIPVVFHNGSNYDENFIIENSHMNLSENLNTLGTTQKSTIPFQLQ